MELTAMNVSKIFEQCLASDKSDKNFVEVEGIINTFGLDMFWVTENKENIRSMLLQLDEGFMNDVGGGWTFLNMPMRADGVQWGEQIDAEKLLVLGVACGLANVLVPRNMWGVFPGGVPYINVVRKED